MKEQPVNNTLKFADEIWQKTLKDIPDNYQEWFNNLNDIEKKNVEFMSKAVAIKSYVDLCLKLKLKPIEITDGPKPVNLLSV